MINIIIGLGLCAVQIEVLKTMEPKERQVFGMMTAWNMGVIVFLIASYFMAELQQ